MYIYIYIYIHTYISCSFPVTSHLFSVQLLTSPCDPVCVFLLKIRTLSPTLIVG